VLLAWEVLAASHETPKRRAPFTPGGATHAWAHFPCRVRLSGSLHAAREPTRDYGVLVLPETYVSTSMSQSQRRLVKPTLTLCPRVDRLFESEERDGRLRLADRAELGVFISRKVAEKLL
jgi:hypothetical protein